MTVALVPHLVSRRHDDDQPWRGETVTAISLCQVLRTAKTRRQRGKQCQDLHIGICGTLVRIWGNSTYMDYIQEPPRKTTNCQVQWIKQGSSRTSRWTCRFHPELFQSNHAQPWLLDSNAEYALANHIESLLLLIDHQDLWTDAAKRIGGRRVIKLEHVEDRLHQAVIGMVQECLCQRLCTDIQSIVEDYLLQFPTRLFDSCRAATRSSNRQTKTSKTSKASNALAVG